MTKSLILSHTEIALKLDRIAWQIIEQHYDNHAIVIVGLQDRGADVAQKIKLRLEKFSDIKILFTTINLDKTDALNAPVTIANSQIIKENSIILVDDVLNSGTTMVAALKEILAYSPKSVRTAVLANRDHHKFPIQANYVGVSLATTLKEHITYEEVDGKMSVSLS
ncbi:MAG: phosphoribosyltransferase [Bacteroidetes bacterium]|nr:MAG: phosphoribosyltransferase [Bacteroidota bacterium]